MINKHLATILSVALMFSSTTQAAEMTKAAKIKKAATTFLSGAGTSLLLNVAAYAGAATLFKNNNPYFLGTACLVAATVTSLAGQKVAESAKGEELTTKESVQQYVADFFANIASGALMISVVPDAAARNMFFGVSAAKLASLFWWIGQLPETPGTGLEEHIPTPVHDHTTTIIQQAPQEIQAVVPAPKPVVAPKQDSAETSNYPWMGGDKPNYHDAFMLMGS